MVKLETTSIRGLYVFNGLRFDDLRGQLIKPFSEEFFKDVSIYNINMDVKEVWFTKSKKDVVRGMHMQIGAKACSKFVSVIHGEVVDVVIDLRKESSTYLNIFDIKLNSLENKVLYIPAGCAHGYKVIADGTITMYLASETHDAANDLGVKWDSINYDWNIESPIVSEKDENLMEFSRL